MGKEALLLKPGEHTEGTVLVAAVDPMPPGPYRLEIILYGWRGDTFSAQDRTELAEMGNPFLSGEIPASPRIVLKQ